MEPASTLATVALAAATVLPSTQAPTPTMTVILRNWVNKNAYPINIYRIEENDYDLASPTDQNPIAQIMPGQTCDISIPLEVDRHNNTLRFRAERNDPRCCLDLRFSYCTDRMHTHLPVPNFGIFFHTRSRGWARKGQHTCFSKDFDYSSEDVPKHLVFEIDGKILGCDMAYSRLSAQEIKKTKIE